MADHRLILTDAGQACGDAVILSPAGDARVEAPLAVAARITAPVCSARVERPISAGRVAEPLSCGRPDFTPDDVTVTQGGVPVLSASGRLASLRSAPVLADGPAEVVAVRHTIVFDEDAPCD